LSVHDFRLLLMDDDASAQGTRTLDTLGGAVLAKVARLGAGQSAVVECA
jgi:hypothetical protein